MVEHWTDSELEAAVDAYLNMLTDELNGRRVVKAHTYRELSEKVGRNAKAWEFRMQNISYVLDGLGLQWIDGLKPAKNVGQDVAARLVKLIEVRPFPQQSRAPTLDQVTQDAETEGAFNPGTASDQRTRVLASIVRRRGQPAFRAALIKAYGGRCAVTGCDVLDALEAAHIFPYLDGETNAVSNGLLLRADIHTLFDLRLIAIDPDTRTVLVAPSLRASTYASLKGVSLATTAAAVDRASPHALVYHRAKCDW